MTKQSRQYLINKLSIATYYAACASDYGNSIRAFKKNQISSQQLARDLSKACTVSARLGKDEPPLHCPRRSTSKNKPTGHRNYPG